MLEFLAAAWAALALGVMTAVCPCPLAGNLAAMSYLGRRVGSPRRALVAGLAFAAGAALAYTVLASVTVSGLAAVPAVAGFLERTMNRILGPILILVGMVLLELVRPAFRVSAVGPKVQERAERGGLVGAGLLGVALALSLCPSTIGLFFFTLVPLAVEHRSRVVLPIVYGVGTAIPAVAFAVLVAYGAKQVGQAFNRLSQVERWARRVAGAVFVLVGVYYSLTYIFGVIPPIGRWLR